jgi:hypothetical protein
MTWAQMSTIGLGIDPVTQLVAQRRPDVTLLDALHTNEYPALRTLADEWQRAAEDALGDDDVTIVIRILDQQTIDAPA